MTSPDEDDEARGFDTDTIDRALNDTPEDSAPVGTPGAVGPVGGATDTPRDPGAVDRPAPMMVFGYFDGFAAGVQLGYGEGRRDLERAKSDAASDGWRRGVAAAERFQTADDGDAGFILRCIAAAVIGSVIGRVIRDYLDRRDAATLDQEGASDELPDVRD